MNGNECVAEQGMTFNDWIYSSYYNENVAIYGPDGSDIRIFMENYGSEYPNPTLYGVV